MIIFFGSIAFLYVLLILFLLLGYHKLSCFSSSPEHPKLGFSIIVVFRNEITKLPNLFKSLSAIEYPNDLFEIILVNDASEDASKEISVAFKNSCPGLDIEVLDSLRKSISPKKDALLTGIKTAKHEYILTTDADCEVPKNWLNELNSYIRETGAQFVAGPVGLKKPQKRTFPYIFQELDMLALQGTTMGGFGIEKPFMCNGGNLCYDKKSFFKLNGFHGNDDIASGDDIFLLEKFINEGLKTGYLKNKNTIVYTSAQPTLSALVSQRIRWAAKASAYKNHFGKITGAIVLVMNFSLVVGLFLTIFHRLPYSVLGFFFLIKILVDFLLIHQSNRFFQIEKILRYYLCCSLLFPLFSSFVAISSLFLGYEWKKRRFKK